MDSGEFYRSGDQMYLGFDTGDLDVEPGSTYRIEFEVDGGQNPYTTDSESETLTREVQIKERVIDFDENPVIVGAAKDQRIHLSSTVAPGTKFSFELLSESVDNPFVKSASATVSENGTLAPKFNFNDVNGKTSFEITISGEDVTETGHVGGLPEEETETPTETPTETETEPRTETGTSTNTSTSSGAENTTEDGANSGNGSGEDSSSVANTTTTAENGKSGGSNGTDAEQTTPGATSNSTQNGTTPTPNNSGGGGGGGIPTNIISMGIAVVVVGVIVKVAT